MQVILLAAGQSTRLDPISDKNTLEFCGKPLIEHQVSVLKQAKMRDIAVVANQFNIEKITEILKKYSNVMVVEQKKLEDGMAGGVLAGASMVKHKNIMIVSTNDIVDPYVFEAVIQASKKEVDGIIVGRKVESYFPGGYLKIDKNNLVTDIIEKPGEGKEPSKLVNLVCHVYNDFPAFVSHLKKVKSKKDDLYEVALSQYIKKDKAEMLVYKYTGSWHAIKYPWDVLKLMEFNLKKLEHKIDKTAVIAKTAIINGNVYIGPKVKVYDHAVIQGPAYIAAESVIATNALVRNSMIGQRCVIGFSTEVARSYLNRDVWCHSNYIGDSIVDENVSFGSGAVLGNLRFDEANVKVNVKKDRVDTGTNKFGAVIGEGARIGINACTNPGIKIGRNSFIGGGVHLTEDVPDNKLVLSDQKTKITSNEKSVKIEGRGEMKKKLHK